MGWIIWILVGLVSLYIAMGIYLAAVSKWEDDRTVGLNYYGRSLADRARFKRTLAAHSSLLAPILWLHSRLTKVDFTRGRIQYKGVSAPTGSCSLESFQRAESYAPVPDDVFVVTPMKCGTTWMQNLVYEILHRGRGTLADRGAAIYAVSPWLEGRKGVSIQESKPVGVDRKARIIRTHLPVALCPYDPAARFIYVARHPASCFASCVDYAQNNLGGKKPGMQALEEWFCSKELMWWGTWTDHVIGWWRWSQEQKNVLFVFFEDMKADLPLMIRKVAAFIRVNPLSDAEVETIANKCSLDYMTHHRASFEMIPPHILQSGAKMFVSGAAPRHEDIPDDVRLRVQSWAARELAGTGFPLARAYPDIAASN